MRLRPFAALVGTAEDFGFEHRLLNAGCLVVLAVTVISLPLNFVAHLPANILVCVTVLGGLHVAFYWAARFRSSFTPVLIGSQLSLLILYCYMWFYNDGAGGSMPYFFFATCILPLVIASGWTRILLFGAFAVAPGVLFAVEYLHPDWIARGYDDRAARFLDVGTSYPLAVAALGSVVFVLTRNYRETLRRLHQEQDRSQRLLHNMLPPMVAERLKDSDVGQIAEAFGGVTVLFADIVGFTARSARMRPEDVVALLNEIFSRFDQLTQRHGLEKIKTIGDAYMAVAGIPVPRPDHAEAAALLALEMLDAVGHDMQLRIGLHSGPAVAGVIGSHKFAYDLWGDTVNTASRMESHSEPGRIQVSRSTRDLLDGSFSLERRGVISVKGKGEMETFFLIR